MKTSRYVLMLVLLWISLVSSAAETGQTLVSAELKSEPYLDAKTLATLPANSPVEILKRQGGWLQVKPADGGDGWVKMAAIKLGGATDAKGDSGLSSLWNVAQGGRSGNTGVTVATGVRGLGTEELKNASANPEALKKMKGFAVSRNDAESYSGQVRLQRQKIAYLAADDVVSSSGSAKPAAGGSAK